MTDHIRSETARRRRETREPRWRPRVVAAADTGSRHRRGRHADPALHVLSSGADAFLGDRADAARGRRPDDRRDRQRVPRSGSDDGAADQPRQADASRPPACPFRMPDARRARAAAPRRAARAVSHLQRGLHRQLRRPQLHATDLVERSDPAHARGSRAAARRSRGRRTAGADAADRCPPRRAHRAPTAN